MKRNNRLNSDIVLTQSIASNLNKAINNNKISPDNIQEIDQFAYTNFSKYMYKILEIMEDIAQTESEESDNEWNTLVKEYSRLFRILRESESVYSKIIKTTRTEKGKKSKTNSLIKLIDLDAQISLDLINILNNLKESQSKKELNIEKNEIVIDSMEVLENHLLERVEIDLIRNEDKKLKNRKSDIIN
tara:strand:- start:311 stop:874 length:564 start_codon:yes stop_codon:yes gene_type:complete